MPTELRISTHLKRQGWKVKIFDKERLEEPHVTIMFKTTKWRLALRSLDFLNDSPNPSSIPEDLLGEIEDNHDWLNSKWDAKYPENPVRSGAD